MGDKQQKSALVLQTTQEGVPLVSPPITQASTPIVNSKNSGDSDHSNPPTLTTHEIRLLRQRLGGISRRIHGGFDPDEDPEKRGPEPKQPFFCADGPFFLWIVLVIIGFFAFTIVQLLQSSDLFKSVSEAFSPDTDLEIVLNSCVVSLNAVPNITNVTFVINFLSRVDNVAFSAPYDLTRWADQLVFRFQGGLKSCRADLLIPQGTTLRSLNLTCSGECLLYQRNNRTVSVRKINFRSARALYSTPYLNATVNFWNYSNILNLTGENLFIERTVEASEAQSLAEASQVGPFSNAASDNSSSTAGAFSVQSGPTPLPAVVESTPTPTANSTGIELFSGPPQESGGESWMGFDGLPFNFSGVAVPARQTLPPTVLAYLDLAVDVIYQSYRSSWNVWKYCNLYSAWSARRASAWCPTIYSPDFLLTFNITQLAINLLSNKTRILGYTSKYHPGISLRPFNYYDSYSIYNYTSFVFACLTYLALWLVLFILARDSIREEREAVARITNLHSFVRRPLTQIPTDREIWIHGSIEPHHQRFWYMNYRIFVFDTFWRIFHGRIFRYSTNYRRLCRHLFQDFPSRPDNKLFWKEFKLHFRLLFFKDFPRKRLQMRKEMIKRHLRASSDSQHIGILTSAVVDLTDPSNDLRVLDGQKKNPRVQPLKWLKQIGGDQFPKNRIKNPRLHLHDDDNWVLSRRLVRSVPPLTPQVSVASLKQQTQQTILSALTVRVFRLGVIRLTFQALVSFWVLKTTLNSVYLHNLGTLPSSSSLQRPPNYKWGWFQTFGANFSVQDLISGTVGIVALSLVTLVFQVLWAIHNHWAAKLCFLTFNLLEILMFEFSIFVFVFITAYEFFFNIMMSWTFVVLPDPTESLDMVIVFIELVIIVVVVMIRCHEFRQRSKHLTKSTNEVTAEVSILKRKQYLYEKWLQKQASITEAIAGAIKASREPLNQSQKQEADSGVPGVLSKETILVDPATSDAKRDRSKADTGGSRGEAMFTRRMLKNMIKNGIKKDTEHFGKFFFEFLSRLMVSAGHSFRVPPVVTPLFLFFYEAGKGNLTEAVRWLERVAAKANPPDRLLQGSQSSIVRHIFDVVFGVYSEPARSDKLVSTVLATQFDSEKAAKVHYFLRHMTKVRRQSLGYLLTAKKEIDVPAYLGDKYIFGDLTKCFHMFGFNKPFTFTHVVAQATNSAMAEVLTPAMVVSDEANLVPEFAKYLPSNVLITLRSLTAVFEMCQDCREIELIVENPLCTQMVNFFGIDFGQAMGVIGLVTGVGNVYVSQVFKTIIRHHKMKHNIRLLTALRLLFGVDMPQVLEEMLQINRIKFELLTLLTTMPDNFPLAIRLFLTHSAQCPRSLIESAVNFLQNNDGSSDSLKLFIRTHFNANNREEQQMGWTIRKIFWIRKLLSREPLNAVGQRKIDGIVFHICGLTNLISQSSFGRLVKDVRKVASLSRLEAPQWLKVKRAHLTLRKYGMPTLNAAEVMRTLSPEGLTFPTSRVQKTLSFLGLTFRNVRLALQYCTIMRFRNNLYWKPNALKNSVCKGSLLLSLFFRPVT